MPDGDVLPPRSDSLSVLQSTLDSRKSTFARALPCEITAPRSGFVLSIRLNLSIRLEWNRAGGQPT